MELVIAIFLGVWLIVASVLTVVWLKKEFKPYMQIDGKGEEK